MYSISILLSVHDYQEQRNHHTTDSSVVNSQKIHFCSYLSYFAISPLKFADVDQFNFCANKRRRNVMNVSLVRTFVYLFMLNSCICGKKACVYPCVCPCPDHQKCYDKDMDGLSQINTDTDIY